MSTAIRIVLVLCLAGTHLFTYLAGAPAGGTRLEDRSEAAAKIAEGVRSQYRLPGLSVTVASGGEIRFSQGFGFADLENRVAATPQTQYRLGSISKLLTVAALARLYQKGRIALDAQPQRHVPSFPLKDHPLTLRQLASHTAGIRHYRTNDPNGCPPSKTDASGRMIGQHWENLEAGLELFADDDLVHVPGTAYQYSTFAYTLLGVALEKASGKSFVDLLRDEVFEPLEMHHSGIDQNLLIIEDRADFYVLDPKTGEVGNAPCNDSSYKWPGGGLLASSEDLARFALAHLREGYLSDETLRAVFEPQPNAAQGDFKVALGWRISRDDQGRLYYHHGGAIIGGRAFVLAYPEQQLVVTLLANTFARFGLGEARQLAELYLP